MGRDIRLDLIRPAELAAAELDAFAGFIQRHGRVPPGQVRANLERACLIAVARAEESIAGLSCLKVPRPAYLDDLCRRTGLNLQGFFERGYTCVAPGFRGRGLARRLTTALLQEAGQRPVYVLAGADDAIIGRLLRDTEMTRLLQFDSRKAGRKLALWVNAAGLARLGRKPDING